MTPSEADRQVQMARICPTVLQHLLLLDWRLLSHLILQLLVRGNLTFIRRVKKERKGERESLTEGPLLRASPRESDTDDGYSVAFAVAYFALNTAHCLEL